MTINRLLKDASKALRQLRAYRLKPAAAAVAREALAKLDQLKAKGHLGPRDKKRLSRITDERRQALSA
jgi:hypothetical protein